MAQKGLALTEGGDRGGIHLQGSVKHRVLDLRIFLTGARGRGDDSPCNVVVQSCWPFLGKVYFYVGSCGDLKLQFRAAVCDNIY